MKRSLRVYRRRAVGTFIALGVVVGAVLGLALAALDGSDIGRPALHGAIVGTFAGLLVGVTEEYFVPELGRRVGFGPLNSFRFVVYAAGMAISVLLGNVIPRVLIESLSPPAALEVYLAQGHPGRDMIVGVVAAFVMTFLLQLRRLHNREELWHLFTGRYHSPKVERRVFMFVDLADSTGSAEALGPTRYSAYLRDVFRDMAEPILSTRGLVYQHAGDAAIVSWRFERGVRDAACVHCFMGIAEALDRNGPRYEAMYGRRPMVRGAIHGGEVVATWVGEAKRELAFHGDTLNTVARLQGLASTLDRPLLVSEVLRHRLDLPGYQTERLGAFDLRGRTASAEVYAVSPVDRNRVAW
ncbi:MAG: adenylate/guanylate cyclase domain-containing protein [Gemmatimonadetes bacterium]|nr:adenylate/guanylate cyclase domain-containing protein [Gemmatimonadota bacterium]NNK62186.1 adenylate/guanylate cyclase domain-containing protein [Gemmatimonadota bacterium]